MGRIRTITFFFQAEDGIRDDLVTGVQTCALPIYSFSCCPDSSTTHRLELGRCTSRLSSGHRFSLTPHRSEERRVGKECRSRRSPYHEKKKKEESIVNGRIANGLYADSMSGERDHE